MSVARIINLGALYVVDENKGNYENNNLKKWIISIKIVSNI